MMYRPAPVNGAIVMKAGLGTRLTETSDCWDSGHRLLLRGASRSAL